MLYVSVIVILVSFVPCSVKSMDPNRLWEAAVGLTYNQWVLQQYHVQTEPVRQPNVASHAPVSKESKTSENSGEHRSCKNN